MARSLRIPAAFVLCGAVWGSLARLELQGAEAQDTEAQIQELRQQNQVLQRQLTDQQKLIESLSQQVKRIEQGQGENNRPSGSSMDAGADLPAQQGSGAVLGRLSISGEGGVGFFHSGTQGMFPNAEFRLDEARLFFEAPIVDNVYIFTELNLATREEPDVQLRLGEAYLDFENLSRFCGLDRLVNLRIGRIYTPFGEEYLHRYAIDNPLISHSLPDLWSVDEGLELYGARGKFSYAFAVQNGGMPDTRDYNPDKALALRVGFEARPWLYLSASAMRTGNLDVNGDQLSAMWFGNGFFRSLGSARTTAFHVEAVEGDVQVRLPHGTLSAFGGMAHYDDNDPGADNGRQVYYYSVEAVHDLFDHFYAAARFSQIFADKGFPIVGNGDFGYYFFRTLTKDLWRLSLGVGYRWNQNLLLKAEYTFERGTELDGDARDHEDLFAMEAAFRF